ncbi:SpoIIE family protein phosphatase [Uliginosibacterium sp. H1]|uniref:SpoIIE family protein phosphatase n=1 Tax=Uliginosibacterium sp. H1 TaxID=3114757 RepID=UPI002E199BE2|nr:SpoIIE family protein phosphatase [Uliginosibacterium sp. H1]
MAQRSFKVLVADDTQANRTLLRAYLGRLGFDTIQAEDGAQAVEVFEAERPDIVLMDVMMPNMDGCEATRRIRSLPTAQWVPILIVSALDAEYDIVRGLEAGADDYLTKPLSYQVFSARMRNLVRTLELQRSREEAMQRISAVSDAVMDGIITFDAMCTIVNCNSAAVALFGEPVEAMTGKHFAALLDEPHRLPFAQAMRRHLDAGADSFIGRLAEVSGLRGGGQSFPMELCVTELPVTDRPLFIGVVRDISERKRVEQQLGDNASRLQQYHDEAEDEAELAKEIMERHVRRDGLAGPGVHHWVQPTARFSGDIVLAARSPAGRLYALLADATGHGLAAAMSGLSTVTYFYQAVAQDMPLARMVGDINNSLCSLLPSGRFMSAALVCLDLAAREAQVWVGGVPDVVLLDEAGAFRRRFGSSQLPMGIAEMTTDECVCETFAWSAPGQLLLFSDGVLEADRGDGEAYGYDGLAMALRGTAPDARIAAINDGLEAHLRGEGAHDDVSILLLDLPA